MHTPHPTANNTITKALALVVSLVGTAVMLCWIFEVPELTAIVPGWITVEFTTGLCFLFSGVMLFAIAHSALRQSFAWQSMQMASSLSILLFMGTFLLSVLLHIDTGVQSIFVEEAMPRSSIFVPGLPSLFTMINFTLFALAGTLALRIHFGERLLHIAGWVLAASGSVVLLGYALHVPVLTYSIVGVSGPVSMLTALVFILLGLGCVAADLQPKCNAETSTPVPPRSLP